MDLGKMNDITIEQLELMKHALGISYKTKSYRNYFVTSPMCDGYELWEDLFEKKYATKQSACGRRSPLQEWH